jgi:hypothetical protein
VSRRAAVLVLTLAALAAIAAGALEASAFLALAAALVAVTEPSAERVDAARRNGRTRPW